MKNRILAISVSVFMLLAIASIDDEPTSPTESPTQPDSPSESEAPETPTTSQTGQGSAFPEQFAFTAADIYGNQITEQSLGEKEVFFVYLWATWCPPCLESMPKLASLSNEYKDRVGFLGLVSDFDSNASGAVNIVESAKLPNSFFMIDANDPSVAALKDRVATGYVPAPALVTVSGEVINISGEDYAKKLDEILAD